MIKIYKTYNKVKKYFKKPILKFHIGKRIGIIPVRNKLPIIWWFISDVMWKDKFESPRYEYPPQINIILFSRLQFIIWLKNPINDNSLDDDYWEQILWCVYYSDNNIEKAKGTWGWINDNKESTWNDNFLK